MLALLITFVALIALQRVLELLLSRRHERGLEARGTYERGASHYPIIAGCTWCGCFPRIRKGPYKYVQHLNYLAVALEIFSAPLIFDASFTTLAFTLLNAGALSVRIRTGARALREVYRPC
jgi:methyltransferase